MVDGQLVLKGLVASPDRVLKQKPVAWTAVDTCLYTLFYACGSHNITGIVTTTTSLKIAKHQVDTCFARTGRQSTELNVKAQCWALSSTTCSHDLSVQRCYLRSDAVAIGKDAGLEIRKEAGEEFFQKMQELPHVSWNLCAGMSFVFAKLLKR